MFDKAIDPFNIHSESHPHWSETIEWRDGRWDAMSSAPTAGKIMEVRGRSENGNIFEPMHYAYGGGDEQPAFRGWFIPAGGGYMQVLPVEWQPLRAKP
jgi:hypothetical protein